MTTAFRPENRMTFTSPDGWWGFDVKESGTIHICVRGLKDDDDDWFVIGGIGTDTLIEGLKTAGVIDGELFEMVRNLKRGIACSHCGLPAGQHTEDCGSFRITEHTEDGRDCNAHDHGHCSIVGCANPAEPDPVVGRAICDRCLTPNGVLRAMESEQNAPA